MITADVPANAVVAGAPARIIRMRDAPETMRWPDPVEPEGEGVLAFRESAGQAAETPRSPAGSDQPAGTHGRRPS